MTSPSRTSDRPHTVADLMSRDVVTIGPAATIRDLARLLQRHDVTGLPVVDEVGELLGTVSITDILWLSDRLPPLLRRGDDEDGDGDEVATVREIMTADLFSVEPTASLTTLLDFFARTGLHRAPVLEDGELVGIVSASDLLPLITGEEG